MSAPLEPPMLHYAVYINGYGRLDVVVDRRIDTTRKMPEWIEVKEYHPDVEKDYWNAYLRPIWIRIKRINVIKFIEYVKPPKGEGFKP